MTYTPGKITVDPTAVGATLTVALTSDRGAYVKAYTDAAGTILATFPASVAARTTYYIPEKAPNPITVSALYGTTEIAGGFGQTLKVGGQGSEGYSIEVRPTLETSELAAVLAAQVASNASTYASIVGPTELTNGEGPYNRFLAVSTLTMTSQVFRAVRLKATVTETITKLAAHSAGTPAGATPTLVRMGVYTVDGSGNLTLAHSTANDTALLAAGNTRYEKALQTSWNKVQGTVYYLGLLVVTGATAPTVVGNSTANSVSSQSPQLCLAIAAQADLPASVSAATVASSTTPGSVYLEAIR